MASFASSVTNCVTSTVSTLSEYKKAAVGKLNANSFSALKDKVSKYMPSLEKVKSIAQTVLGALSNAFTYAKTKSECITKPALNGLSNFRTYIYSKIPSFNFFKKA
jgi:hypothetical protein